MEYSRTLASGTGLSRTANYFCHQQHVTVTFVHIDQNAHPPMLGLKQLSE